MSLLSVQAVSKNFGGVKAVEKMSIEIEKGKYPDTEHSYHMKSGELDKLKEILKDKC